MLDTSRSKFLIFGPSVLGSPQKKVGLYRVFHLLTLMQEVIF